MAQTVVVRSCEEAGNNLVMDIGRKQPRDVETEQIRWREIEFSALGRFVPATVVVLPHIGVEQVRDVLEVSFALRWTITEGNHFQDREDGGRRDENTVSLNDSGVGMSRGEVHAGEAHHVSALPPDLPYIQEPWTCR